MRSHVHGVILSLVSASRPAKLRFQPVLIQLRLVVTREGIALQRCSVRTYVSVVHFTTARSILINYKSLLETSWRHYRSMLPLRTFVFLSRCEGGKLIYRLDSSYRARFMLFSRLVSRYVRPLLPSPRFSLFTVPARIPFFSSTSISQKENREKRKEKGRKKKVSSRVNARPVSHPQARYIAPDKPSLLEIRSRSTSSILFPRMISIRSLAASNLGRLVARSSMGGSRWCTCASA